MLLRPFAALLVSVASLGGASSASAELLTLTSGRTLSVRSLRIDGDRAVVSLRGGGDVECAAALIASVAPDEVEDEEVPETHPSQAASIEASETHSAPPGAYHELVVAAAKRHQVDPRLVHAVIMVESRYQATARSRKGAMGLMQLMPATARELEVRNPFDPAANIDGGVRHLRQLLDRFDLRHAIAAYNAGAGAVRRFGGIPPFRETQAYVRQVLQLAGVS